MNCCRYSSEQNGFGLCPGRVTQQLKGKEEENNGKWIIIGGSECHGDESGEEGEERQMRGGEPSVLNRAVQTLQTFEQRRYRGESWGVSSNVTVC